MSDFHDVEGAPIPLLNDTLVPGNLLRGRDVSPFEKAAAAHHAAAVPDPVPAGEPDSLLVDAEALVERLSGRAMGWLTGEGRSVIEQRCAAALQEHSHWIVGQVSREIGLALETELKGWVKAALREELAARAGKSTPPEA
ncbi:DUF2486 family protein [Paraburkholderia oxyphila]|uniref:DUF2486 family protein n=1 Tax=Paraburkholderia oxyphila TaxID=614212 RepID=UPI001428B114|nr:DUF2486 family protein [Paraburkholderia oxyphila]